jgi:hypothetical protein
MERNLGLIVDIFIHWMSIYINLGDRTDSAVHSEVTARRRLFFCEEIKGFIHPAQSAWILVTRKLGGEFIQQLVTSKVQACLAQRWARVFADLITCETSKDKNEKASPSISCIIGAMTAREPVRDSQKSTTSLQSVSISTRVKPRSFAKMTPSLNANASAIKGLVTPGYGLLHAPMKPEGLRATPPAPDFRFSKDTPASVLIFIQSSSGGLQPWPGSILA